MMSNHDPDPASSTKRERKPKARRRLTKRKCRSIVAAVMPAPMIALSVGLLASPSASAAQPASSNHSASAPGAAGGGSNARSGPAAGGASGTVTSVSKSGFTMTTSAGQKVTVDEASSTKYKKGSNSISVSAVKRGTHVLVLGTVSSTTIKATQVIVASGGTAAATAATVVPFQKGSPTTSKQVGKIPTSYTEGSGTIVSGITATKATEAALAAYPGGVVDRVVKLSDGEYEVHSIGVNWPHHIFVNQDFKVVGAE
jgi:membrane-bound inhibitor of C-type lysozyme